MFKNTKKIILPIVIASSILMSGCSFEAGNTTSLFSNSVVKYNTVDIFETIEDFNVKVEPLSYKKETKKENASYVFTFKLTNENDEKVTLNLDSFTGLNENGEVLENLEFETKTSINLNSGEEKEFTLTISGDEESTLNMFTFVIEKEGKRYKLEISDFENFSYKIINDSASISIDESI